LQAIAAFGCWDCQTLRVCQPLLQALAGKLFMRNFLSNVSCQILRGCFGFVSLFVGFVVVEISSAQSLAAQFSNRSVSCQWFSLCGSKGNLISVRAQCLFALQLRKIRQFRARQATGFCGNCRALTRATIGRQNPGGFRRQFCWRYENMEIDCAENF